MGLLFGDVLGGFFFFSSFLAAWRDLFMREIGGPESIFFLGGKEREWLSRAREYSPIEELFL